MGTDKRFLTVEGATLLRRTFEAVRSATDDVAVLIADPEDTGRVREEVGPVGEILVDALPGEGPLAALGSALGRVARGWALLVAVDMPRLTGPFLGALVGELRRRDGRPPALVPVWRDVPQVACAIYATSLAGPIRRAVGGGEQSLRRFTENELPPEAFLDETTWSTWGPGDIFRDVDIPADLERDG